MSRRIERVNELILREIGSVVAKEIETAGPLLTFTRVQTSSDLHYTDIYFTSFPTDALEEMYSKLEKKVFSIQQSLNKRLRMRPVPKIRFHIDKTEREAAKIDEIIKEL